MVAKLKLEISEELKNENSLWTPGSRQSVEQLWAAFESDPEKLPVDQLPNSAPGEFVSGGSKKRKQVVAEPPLSKEEALARFKARKEAAHAEKRQKLCAFRFARFSSVCVCLMVCARPSGATCREADESQVLFEERRFVLVWAKTAGATAASKDAVTSSVISSVVSAYAGRPATEAEEAACDAVLAEMSADRDTAVDGAVQPYRALKYLREHSGNALFTTLARVPASR